MHFHISLLKMLSRVGRHVDDAQEAVTALAGKPVSKLTVYLNGETLAWEQRGPSPSWRSFQSWYYGRPQSESFIVRFQSGEEMFLRKNIRRFKIENWSE